jgi:hypothetical protein
MQKYPKITSIQKVSDKNTVPVLEYLCFIGKWGKLVKIITSMSNFPLYFLPMEIGFWCPGGKYPDLQFSSPLFLFFLTK